MADAAISIAGPDEFAQPAPWRAFRDPSVEASYREWHRERILPVVRTMALFTGLLCATLPLSYLLMIGPPPRLLTFTTYAITCPIALAVTIASFTSLRRWTDELYTAGNIAFGLSFTWVTSTLFSPNSGAVACAILTTIFYPLILRVRTGATAIAAITLTAVPVGLVMNSMRSGELNPQNGWLYLVALVSALPLVIVAAAVTDAGMRQQFVTEQTVVRQQSQLQASQRLLRRYVPEQVADVVLSGRPEAVERHERRKLTVFFSDLVGFTDLSDEMEPEDLAMVLHDYFTEMSGIAKRHSGTVDDLVGDAILAFFGAPDSTNDHDQALRAVRMAVEMQEAMGPLNQKWASAGIPETLTVRMGVNTGVATVGNFGSAERTKYTALGKQVNVAARIQSQCEPGKVLLGHATWLLVRDEIPCTPKGELTLKGLHKPMPAYEVQT